MTPEDKLRELFLDPDLIWLTERLRTRLRQGRELSGTATHANATAAQRRAADNLLGRATTRGRTLNISLPALAAQLRAAHLAEDLHAVVTACFGEVVNEREVRDSTESAWRALFERGRAQLRGDREGVDWLRSLESDGLLKRFAKGDPQTGEAILANALAVWLRLPLDSITLAEFASEMTGDTHALDRGQPLSPILLRGLHIRTGHPGNKDAESRRRAWQAVGVVVDQLSAPVLTFNLRAQAESHLEKILALHRESAQPAYLTYQQLRTHGALALTPGMEDVHVVENPALVESAASQLASACRPLVCTEGIPASAARLLLRNLATAGCRLHVRADFDWTGLRIVDQLLALPHSRPWMMDPATYRRIPATVALSGREFEAAWCRDLVEAMRANGMAAYEEQISAELLAELKLTGSAYARSRISPRDDP